MLLHILVIIWLLIHLNSIVYIIFVNKLYLKFFKNKNILVNQKSNFKIIIEEEYKKKYKTVLCQKIYKKHSFSLCNNV